jgi:hypothetical protein
MMLILRSSSKKAGSYIASMIKRNQKLTKEPLFARSYKLTNTKQTKDKYSFQVVNATLNSGFNSKETMETAYQARLVAEAHCNSYDVKREDNEPVKIDKDEDLGLE